MDPQYSIKLTGNEALDEIAQAYATPGARVDIEGLRFVEAKTDENEEPGMIGPFGVENSKPTARPGGGVPPGGINPNPNPAISHMVAESVRSSASGLGEVSIGLSVKKGTHVAAAARAPAAGAAPNPASFNLQRQPQRQPTYVHNNYAAPGGMAATNMFFGPPDPNIAVDIRNSRVTAGTGGVAAATVQGPLNVNELRKHLPPTPAELPKVAPVVLTRYPNGFPRMMTTEDFNTYVNNCVTSGRPIDPRAHSALSEWIRAGQPVLLQQ